MSEPPPAFASPWALVLRAAIAAAGYGFSIGAVHSLLFALRNVIKFPLLILVTATVCGACYYVVARAIARELDARAIARVALAIFHDTSVLLLSLAPVTLFLALTVQRPGPHGLGEYPLFLSVNVALVAVSGSLALLRQCRRLVVEHGVAIERGTWLVAAWLAASLFVGAQASWYMRPFCGVAGVDAPFMMGTAPDFRGATSFYEAVFHVLRPPGH
jgi:hypothetical protein